MKTLGYISAAFAIFPAVAGMMRIKVASFPYRFLIAYFFVCVLTEVISTYCSSHHLNNSLLGNIFYIVEGLMLITWFYFCYKEKEFLVPAIIIGSSYFLYGMYTTLLDPGPWAYNANFRAGESLLVQALSAYSLIRISKEEDVQLMKNPGFWLSTGFFIYFSVNIAVFLTGSLLFDNNIGMMQHTWFIHSYSNMLTNIIFTFGVLCISSQPRR